jgi:hypothetical protein
MAHLGTVQGAVAVQRDDRGALLHVRGGDLAQRALLVGC